MTRRERIGAPAEIEFWFDFASPYAYMAATRIELLAAARGLQIVWRPFLLGAVFKRRSANASAFQEASPAEARYRRRDVERTCEHAGIALRWPSTYPRGSLLAARIALVGASKGWCGPFARAIYHASFVDDRDIAAEPVVADILGTLGHEPAPIIAAAISAPGKAALAAQVERALAKGIFGAPTFVIGEELFWGNDRLEQALDWA